MGGGRGPSSVIPALLISLVVGVVWGPTMMNSAAFLSQVQETTVSFVFIIPVILVLLIYYVSESAILPLLLLLVVHSVSRMLIGPLILVVLIHGLSRFFPSGGDGGGGGGGGEREGGGRYGDEGNGWYGWGSVWLLLLFLVLNRFFSGS